ncbi:MAG: LemA family protein [Bacteroidales bacterium]|nr:LemA family protein [Bacteroidales bacterium]
MKKKSLTIIIILAAVALLAGWIIGSYNKLVRNEENVSNAWAQVETAYQRRADLIPNLVATVKGYAEHESSTLENTMKARGYGNTQPTEQNVAEFQRQEQEISAALSRLMVVIERYPDLKANENFLDLQAQLEGTENRISIARNNFNEAAKTYNTIVRSFPANIVAGMFGFEKKGYFKADEAAATAPTVQF